MGKYSRASMQKPESLAKLALRKLRVEVWRAGVETV